MLKSKSTSEYFTEQESTILKNEKEKLNNLKNQQIRELKNLIEFEFKVQEMRKKNEEKLKLQEQKATRPVWSKNPSCPARRSSRTRTAPATRTPTTPR